MTITMARQIPKKSPLLRELTTRSEKQQRPDPRFRGCLMTACSRLECITTCRNTIFARRTERDDENYAEAIIGATAGPCAYWSWSGRLPSIGILLKRARRGQKRAQFTSG